MEFTIRMKADETSMPIEEDNFVKILGLNWSPSCDSYSFKIHLKDSSTYSNRLVLSAISNIVDPLE